MDAQYLYLPLFPLPNVVFFPRRLLPIHVFEPRDRKMVENVVSGDRLMGVALLKPGWESSYYDTPPVYRVMGMGKILEYEKLGNGNYNIWLSGLERASIIYEIQEKPFRVAKIEIMRDRHDASNPSETPHARREMVETARQLSRVSPHLAEDLRKAIDEQVYPGALADAIASVVCSDSYEKHCVLAERDLCRRIRLVTVQMRMRLNQTLAIKSLSDSYTTEAREEMAEAPAVQPSPPMRPAPES
jgi:uncharacterized protein